MWSCLPPRGSVGSTTSCHWQIQNVPYKSRRDDNFISICIERVSSANISSCASKACTTSLANQSVAHNTNLFEHTIYNVTAILSVMVAVRSLLLGCNRFVAY